VPRSKEHHDPSYEFVAAERSLRRAQIEVWREWQRMASLHVRMQFELMAGLTPHADRAHLYR